MILLYEKIRKALEVRKIKRGKKFVILATPAVLYRWRHFAFMVMLVIDNGSARLEVSGGIFYSGVNVKLVKLNFQYYIKVLDTMIIRRNILFLILLLTAATAGAHPHSFVECNFSFVMDSTGLAGFKQRWLLDEMTTVTVLDVVDADHDQALSTQEKKALRDLTVQSLLEYHYFTVVRINGKDFPVKKITDFSGELKEGKLIYHFFIPCRINAVRGTTQEVTAAVYDSSFYSFVAYVEGGSVGIDPTKDALFADRDAPAGPGDFKRFARAVGVGKYTGKVQIQGNTANFNLTSTVRQEPAMTYFYNQIVPQAFVLSFSLK